MNPMSIVQMVLGGASLAGAILGGQRKTIDINWLREHFGPQAVSDQALQLFHTILNSPMGESIMANAAEQGQQFQRDTARGAAQSGLAGPSGSSGAGIFATSAAKGATDSLQRGVESNFYQMALPAAQNMVSQQLQAYMGAGGPQGYQTPQAMQWQQIGNAAGNTLAMTPLGGQPKDNRSAYGLGSLSLDRQNPNPYQGALNMPQSSSSYLSGSQLYVPRMTNFGSFNNVQPAGGR